VIVGDRLRLRARLASWGLRFGGRLIDSCSRRCDDAVHCWMSMHASVSAQHRHRLAIGSSVHLPILPPLFSCECLTLQSSVLQRPDRQGKRAVRHYLVCHVASSYTRVDVWGVHAEVLDVFMLKCLMCSCWEGLLVVL